MLLLTVLAFVSTAFAQEDLRCTCSLYADSQVTSVGDVMPGAAPLAIHTEILDVANVGLICNTPEGTADPCEIECQDWFNSNYGDEFGYCNREPDGSDRCYGGLFCEILYNDNITNVEQDQITMFYRMPDCQTTRGNWTATGYQLATVLCCEEGMYKSCVDAIDCECYKLDFDEEYCECGVFTPEQLQGGAGETALPLAYVGNDIDVDPDELFCLNLGSQDDPCRDDCDKSGEEYFETYSLNDIFEDTEITYGQAYCQGFVERGYDLSNGLDTTLNIYLRAPTCDVSVGWLAVDPPQTHPDRLCCDSQGDYFEC